MQVLGLDPSTKTGWAIVKVDTAGVIQHETGVESFFGTGIHRMRQVADWVSVFLYDYNSSPFDLVVIEGYAYSNFHTLATLVEIGTALRLGLDHADYPYLDVSPTSLKKFVTGKGNAKKDLVMKEIYKRWGTEFDTTDEADAFGLAMVGVAVLDKSPVFFTADQRKLARSLGK